MIILKWLKKFQEYLNKLHPETRSLIIILLFGYVLYSQINESTRRQIMERVKKETLDNKEAEKYSMQFSVELNRQIQLISERDQDAFNVILLNYHNNTQSLQGYKYLYLSCLTEAPKTLDTPLLKYQWNKIDYTYYADELSKIHRQSFVQINNIDNMVTTFPKLYRLVKASDAKAVSFFTIEGQDSAIGLIVIFYKEPKKYDIKYPSIILPCIQKLAVILDYDNKK